MSAASELENHNIKLWAEGQNLNKNDSRRSVINDQVDIVIPLLLKHLETLKVDYLQLPNTKEAIIVKPLLISYETDLFLSNGIVFNIDGIQRSGNAYVTYENKSFICQMNLMINSLEFKYNFLFKLIFEVFGRVFGYLDNVIIFIEIAIKLPKVGLQLNDFRIVDFNHVKVQLDDANFVGQMTRIIFSPIVNLFRDRITTSFSDGIKAQMQAYLDDFNQNDPLELDKFARQLTSRLTGLMHQ